MQIGFIQIASQENTSLLNFNHKSSLFTVIYGSRQREHNFIDALFRELRIAGVDVYLDFWLPLLAEDLWSLGRLKRDIFHVDTLEGKLWHLILILSFRHFLFLNRKH